MAHPHPAHPWPSDLSVPSPSSDRAASGPSRTDRRGLAALGVLFRAALPLAVLASGVIAYQRLSVAVDEEQEPPSERQVIRTRVAELVTADYPVIIQQNGIVQAHNEVTLSAEIAGQVIEISPQFEVGAYFSRGDLLVRLDPSDYENAVAIAQAQHAGAQAALDLAKLNYERQAKLVTRSAASVADLNQAVATRAQAAAALDTAAAQWEQARRDLERTVIRAPFDGRVRSRQVGRGQSLTPATPLGVVFAIDFAEIRLPIASSDLRYLELPELAGDPPVPVTLRDAIDADNPALWHGRIVRTEGALDENSLEVYAIARVDDPFGLTSGGPPLRIGQPVVGSISGKPLHDVIAIPREAVRQLNHVYLIDKSKLTVMSKQIELVWSDERFVYVRDPEIADGTLLSTTDLVYAPDGAKVEIIPAAESPTTTVSKPNTTTETTH